MYMLYMNMLYSVITGNKQVAGCAFIQLHIPITYCSHPTNDECSGILDAHSAIFTQPGRSIQYVLRTHLAMHISLRLMLEQKMCAF